MGFEYYGEYSIWNGAVGFVVLIATCVRPKKRHTNINAHFKSFMFFFYKDIYIKNFPIVNEKLLKSSKYLQALFILRFCKECN